MTKPEKLAKAFGIFLLVMFIVYYGLGPVLNTIPWFLYWSLVIVPTISIVVMAVYQFLIYKAYRELERGKA